MQYVIAAVVLARIIFPAWLFIEGRKSGGRRVELKVEQTGRKQREEFDTREGEWDAGGGLAGRMSSDDDDPAPPAS